MLARKFQVDWLKVIFIGTAETIISFYMKTQFGDIGLSQVTQFGAPCLFCNNTMTPVSNICYLVTATEIIQVRCSVS